MPTHNNCAKNRWNNKNIIQGGPFSLKHSEHPINTKQPR